ncbi:hypothetical protein J1N35_018643 [Gossypium stocksii]|uniref:Zinc knuckle CX2CX4HX4C domain-containing protein n=1 Tax=Gossypium stocksii TaxID=47602 RepID=A0A9D3VPI4_9ROSI|nr:hypothetical protein J1N35_018643 [Gossypium stocksii]
MAGQNLFQLSFEDEDDLERIMDEATERSKLKLVFSPFWLKFGSCPPECEKKDLMHAIGSTLGGKDLMHAIGLTFGGILRSDLQGETCRIKILLDERKPLRIGIFITVGTKRSVWLPFKYELLSNFCFGWCGIMGYIVKDCNDVMKQGKYIREDNIPYSIALKAESSLLGRESLRLGKTDKKFTEQRVYTGEEEDWSTSLVTIGENNIGSKEKGTVHTNVMTEKNMWMLKHESTLQRWSYREPTKNQNGRVKVEKDKLMTF